MDLGDKTRPQYLNAKGIFMNKQARISLSLLLIFLLNACSEPASTLTPSVTPAQTTPVATSATRMDTDDPEILRAINYGFVPDELLDHWDETITYSQYCAMLRLLLNKYDESAVTQWDAFTSDARPIIKPMSREDGMVATYYAATLMGLGKTTNGDWIYQAVDVGIDKDVDFEGTFTAKFFPAALKTAPFYDNADSEHLGGWSYATTAKLWTMGQTSAVSGKTTFDIDYAHSTFRPNDPFLIKEAIHAVLRIYESTFTPVENLSATDPESAQILKAADERRSAILNSPTEIIKSDTFIQGKTYTGTAYYVANSGNDSNDGKSPEKPWQSIKRVNRAKLKYGDAVFFNRGDIWYDEISSLVGVTYSAYGTGPKPTISGSVDEKAADPEKWKLVFTGEKGEKIWVYYKDLLDVTGVFFNQGESWANKVYPYWNEKNKQYSFKNGDKFEISTGLANDLDFFSAVDLTKIDPFDRINGTGVTGPLYLRSDSGNPGEVYSNIEFSQEKMGINAANNYGKDLTVDNLKFVYFGGYGIGAGWTNSVIQNNEIGWSGGEITRYRNETGDYYGSAQVSGCAIQLSGSQTRAINNYIHHSGNKSIVVVTHLSYGEPYIIQDVLISNNLMEYNSAALHLVNYVENEDPTQTSGFKNIQFSDNYVLYSGYGWVEINNQRTDIYQLNIQPNAMEFGEHYNNKNEGIYITNNVFYLGKYALIHCYMPANNQPIFSGNTYAQNENGWLARLRGRLLSITENGETYVHDEFKDETGHVLIVK